MTRSRSNLWPTTDFAHRSRPIGVLLNGRFETGGGHRIHREEMWRCTPLISITSGRQRYIRAISPRQAFEDSSRAVARFGASTPTPCRMGGDEFVIVQGRIRDPAEGHPLAQRIIAVISEAYDIEGQQAIIGRRIGIAVGPGDGLRPRQIVANCRPCACTGARRRRGHSGF